jgi:hypothetical protein
MRPEIACLREQPPAPVDELPVQPRRESRIFVPPPFVQSARVGRLSPRRTPQEYDAASERFVNSDGFRATPIGTQYHREIAARAEARAQDRRQRARERQAAALPDTPQHRAFATRGYGSFGTTGLVAVGAKMLATVEALHAAAPHLSATSEAGRTAQAAFVTIGRYSEGRATNGELDTVLKDLIFAMPPATHHRRTSRPLAGNRPAIERWAKAAASARELLTTVHDMDLQLELDRRGRHVPQPSRGVDR